MRYLVYGELLDHIPWGNVNEFNWQATPQIYFSREMVKH